MNNNYICVENLPIVESYDVIVLGGGIAGVSAAISASRGDRRVLLVEKLCNVGGLATGGLISYFLPVCDGCGNIVSSGIAHELLKMAVENAPAKIKGNITINGDLFAGKERVQSCFYPAVLQTTIDDFLERNGVDTLFDTVAESPVMEDGYCTGIILGRREGRALYKAHVYIDTTGDASVMHKAGASTAEGRNLLSGWYNTLSSDGDFRLSTVGADAHEAFRKSGSNSESNSYRGVTSSEITKYVKDIKKRIWQKEARAVKAGEKIITSIPSVPQMRCHRRIVGIDELSSASLNQHCRTSVGCVSDWREPGLVYEVPFGILVCDRVDNIITAGRTVSVSGEAYEVLRCIPQCAVTGEAAGAAAAIFCSGKHKRLTDLDISELQEKLIKAGVLIHF